MALGGGLKLAHRIMQESLYNHSRIIYVAENPCWDWYTEQVEKKVKTPADAFTYALELSGTKWLSAPHLSEIITKTLWDASKLDFLELPQGRNDSASKLLALVWNILRYRSWTFSKHSLPPENYADVASPDLNEAAAACQRMKTHHDNLLTLEQRCHSVSSASDLWTDFAPIAKSTPVRLLFELFFRDKFQHTSIHGRHLLKGFLWLMPDNKSVEDMHHVARIDSRANMNKRQCSVRLQHVLTGSGIFEQRRVRHICEVTKEQFVRQFKSLKFCRIAWKHRPNKKHLTKEWSKVMNPKKTWDSISEDALQKCVAAWAWLHSYMARRAEYPNLKISDARWCKLVAPCVVITNGAEDYASLGNAVWAVLACPLQSEVVNDVKYLSLIHI